MMLSRLLGEHPWYALVIVLLGFMGGTISGFIGSGGAFLMTPGMMNLGVPGIMAVGANITHKFGKVMMGQRKHRQLGHVDARMGFILMLTALLGIRTAVVANAYFFERLGENGSSLYVSVFFVITLSIIGSFLLRDALKSLRPGMSGPSAKLRKSLERFQIKPLMYFRVANVHVSLPLMIVVGFCVGLMAGTIGVGGFIGVPAMIYLFGAPTVVATGTELFLAMFMGAFGALNYGMGGYVDLRITLLLFAGSLAGLFLGAVGTKIVRESYIRLVTSTLILLCVISRVLAVPGYLRLLGWVQFSSEAAGLLEWASRIFLFGSGVVATTLILYLVFRAHLRELRVFRRYRALVTSEAALEDRLGEAGLTSR
jgi:uncharacterized membrane protein YfcA